MQTFLHSCKRYLHFWTLMATTSLEEALIHRGTSLMFMFGKVVRFAMLLAFLLVIKSSTTSFGNYSTDEIILFFLFFNFIDVSIQLLFRGVYTFSSQIRSGNFDFMLLKPINPLFQALFGKPDILDVFFLFLSGLFSLWLASTLAISLTFTNLLLFLLLVANSILVGAALHILVLAVAMYTTDIDNLIWFYRDVMQFGRFPVSIYSPVIQTLLFFIIPIGMIVTIPAEVLIGRTPTHTLGVTFLVGFLAISFSLAIWHNALKHYSSASS